MLWKEYILGVISKYVWPDLYLPSGKWFKFDGKWTFDRWVGTCEKKQNYFNEQLKLLILLFIFKNNQEGLINYSFLYINSKF